MRDSSMNAGAGSRASEWSGVRDRKSKGRIGFSGLRLHASGIWESLCLSTGWMKVNFSLITERMNRFLWL
jgi:uncharacterized protein YfiM (DUF2279 family)